MANKPTIAREVHFLDSTPLEHSVFPDPPLHRSFGGEKIGNFEGHFAGVEVTEHQDGTFTLVLRAEFTETWRNVPRSAIKFVWSYE